MSPLVDLGAITVALGIGAGPLLSRSGWCQRIPRVAALAWLGVLAGALAGLVGLVALVSTGRHGVVHRAAEWAANCWHHHDGSAGPGPYVFNMTLLISTAVAAYVAIGRYRRTVAHRRRHQEALQFVVRLPGDIDDVCVLDHPLPVAYCVPSRNRPIVVSMVPSTSWMRVSFRRSWRMNGRICVTATTCSSRPSTHWRRHCSGCRPSGTPAVACPSCWR